MRLCLSVPLRIVLCAVFELSLHGHISGVFESYKMILEGWSRVATRCAATVCTHICSVDEVGFHDVVHEADRNGDTPANGGGQNMAHNSGEPMGGSHIEEAFARERIALVRVSGITANGIRKVASRIGLRHPGWNSNSTSSQRHRRHEAQAANGTHGAAGSGKK